MFLSLSLYIHYTHYVAIHHIGYLPNQPPCLNPKPILPPPSQAVTPTLISTHPFLARGDASPPDD